MASLNVPLTMETLKAIKDAAQAVYEVDPETGDHSVVGGGMSLHELLQLMSGSLGAEGIEEDGFVLIDVPTIHPNDIIVALVEEIERLRG